MGVTLDAEQREIASRSIGTIVPHSHIGFCRVDARSIFIPIEQHTEYTLTVFKRAWKSFPEKCFNLCSSKLFCKSAFYSLEIKLAMVMLIFLLFIVSSITC